MIQFKAIFLFVFSFFLSLFAFSQNDTFFIPTKFDSLFFEKEYKQIEERYKHYIETIKGDFKKEYKETYTEAFESIKQFFTEKKLYTNAQATHYLQQIANEITNSNPELKTESINIFFVKTAVPNAAYVGYNTILFNTGLFYRLENESQVAFVLCHELAHYYLKHVPSKIEKYITTVYSKEFQKELKSIKRAEYHQRERLEKLALGFGFDHSKHSRYKETEADSLAVIFMSKTKFDTKEAVGLLQILDSVDIDKFNADMFLEKTFNSPEYPFKKSWLNKEDGLLGGHATIKQDEKLEDSLKTHPDCALRIAAVKKLLTLNQSVAAQKSPINATLFATYMTQFQLENISYFMEKKVFTTALFHALNALKVNPNNSFVVTTIGNIFNEFYIAQKQHKLSTVTSFPSPYYSASLNTVLQFVQNLDITDFKPIGYSFLKKYENQFTKFSQFTTSLNNNKQ